MNSKFIKLFVLTALALSSWTGSCGARDLFQDYGSYRQKTAFFDDFSANRNNWPVSDDQYGRLVVGPEAFVIRHRVAEGSYISLQKFPLSQSADFIFETEIKKVSGVENYGFGIAWGASDVNINDYYQFIISGDGSYLVSRWQGGKEKSYIPWTKSSYLNLWNGSVNRLALVKEGNVIRFYINDNYVNQIAAGQFLGNRFGFLVYQKQEIAVDHVQISAIKERSGQDRSSASEINGTFRKKVVWFDDFSDNPNNWPVADDQFVRLTVGPEEYIVRHKVPDGYISWQKFPLSQSSDFLIETEARKVSGVDNSGFGIVWGASDNNISDRYQFVISGDGSYSVTKLEHGREYALIPWTTSPYLNLWDGSVNRLALAREGNVIRFYINDLYVNQVDAVPFLGGRFGFVVEQIQEIAFDYLQISEIKRIKSKSPETYPEIEITEPVWAKGERRTSAAEIKVAGVAEDIDGIERVTVNGVDATLANNGRFYALIPVAPGNNKISVSATDRKGSSSRVNFSISRDAAPLPVEAATGGADKRLALVIGNSNYTHGGTLANPVHDARAMKVALEGVGFKVYKYENCTQKEMKKAMDDFGRTLTDKSVGLFFYAGHGVQVRGNNYLIPVDARLDNENDVEYDTVRADRVLAKMESAGSETNIVILDACRNNPFERSWRRGVQGNGLAFMNAPSGSIIAYATSPGKTASDGTGRNGLYTSAILQHITTPGITIEQMFKRVRATIMDQSDNMQVPWESTSLRGNFYFKNPDQH